MADERENSPEREAGQKVDMFVRRERVTLEEAALVAEHAASQNEEPKRNPEREYLMDAARRAHDEELSALANLALIRSTLDRRNRFRENDSESREERDRRLQMILEEPEQ